jgi:hypothetical protein
MRDKILANFEAQFGDLEAALGLAPRSAQEGGAE